MGYEFPYVSRKWLYNPRQADLRRFKVVETTQTRKRGTLRVLLSVESPKRDRNKKVTPDPVLNGPFILEKKSPFFFPTQLRPG